MGNSIYIALLASAACSGGGQQASVEGSNDSGDSFDGSVSSGDDGGSKSGASASSGSGIGIAASGGGASTGSGSSGATGSSGVGSTGSSASGAPSSGRRGSKDAGPSVSSDAAAPGSGDASIGPVPSNDAGPSTGCGKSGKAGQVVSIVVGGTTRTYLLTLPTGYTGSTPLPAYVVFHGAGGNHDSMTSYGLQDSVIGIFPDGLARNGGSTGWDTSGNGVDVAMFDAVLSSVAANYCVDQGRIFAIGFSFGASMANSVGCFRGNVLRSFASVEGGILFNNATSDCKGPIPGWINQYQQDPTVSYATGQKAEAFFVSLNSDSNPQAYDAPNPCVVYTGKAPLVWCTPQGAMHAWPPYGTDAIKRFFGTL